MKGIRNSVSPEYWQSHTPESFGEYSDSVVYKTHDDLSEIINKLENGLKSKKKKKDPNWQVKELLFRMRN